MPRANRPSIRLSQNFLRDPALVDHLLRASSIGPADTVLEIGAGTGRITEALALRAGEVVAVEKDATLAAGLRRTFAADPVVSIHEADFRTVHLPQAEYKIFANIPFAMTAEIVNTLTSARNPPTDSYLIVQAEGAERYGGWERESLSSVLLKPWFEPTLLYRFDRTDFDPAPRVDVVMLRLRKRGPPLLSARHGQLFRDFVTYCFTTAHPTLRSALKRLLSPDQLRRTSESLGLPPAATPTAPSLEQWLALFLYLVASTEPELRREVSGAERRLRERQAKLKKVHRTRVAEERR